MNIILLNQKISDKRVFGQFYDSPKFRGRVIAIAIRVPRPPHHSSLIKSLQLAES